MYGECTELTGCGAAQELKFGIGDGKLRYYLYNWRMHRELQAQEVGLILL